MQFEFNDSMLPDYATIERLHSGYPQFFIYVTNNNNIVEVKDISHLSGSQRFISDDIKYSEHFGFRPERITDEATKAKENGATHLITGFYNLIQKQFVQTNTFELPDIINDKFACNVADTSIAKQFNTMYFDKDLWLANLKWRDENFICLHLDYIDMFKGITHLQIHNLVVEYIKEHKNDLKAIDIQGQHFLNCQSMIGFILKKIGKAEDIRFAFALQQVLVAADCVELIMHNKNTEQFDYFDGRLGNFDVRDAIESEDRDNIILSTYVSRKLENIYL